MGKSKKYYVVWEGHKPGVYEDWSKCQQQIKGYPNAKFKSFKTRAEAEDAFRNPEKYQNAEGKKTFYYVPPAFPHFLEQ